MTTTTNRGYSTPATGSQVGIWGSDDINPNFLKVDQNLGAVCSISTTGGTTTLNASQYVCGTISVSGTLTSMADIVFPNVQGWWSIENLTTGNVVRILAGSATEYIGVPPGCITDIQINGSAVRYRNFPPVGTYLTVPELPDWVTSSSKPPYLLCNGQTFSASTYPVLASILGGTITPDARGRALYMLNQGTGRLPIADTRFAAGGSWSSSLVTANLPPYTPAGSVGSSFSGSVTVYGVLDPSGTGTGTSVAGPGGGSANIKTYPVSGSVSSAFYGSPQGGSNAPFQTYSPALVAGVVMIRAA